MLRNLEAEQKSCGYTNANMTELLGISRVTYENKKRTGLFNRPQIETLIRLFNCKFEYLFLYENIESKQPCKDSLGCLANRPA